MTPFAHGETVDVRTATTTTDPYSGETAADWGSFATRSVDGVAVADGGSLEPVSDARNPVDSDFDLIFPANESVTAHDRVVVRGLICEVAGRPFLWRNPFTGWTPGLVVKVKIREG